MKVCLYEPDIPHNVGSMIRLCACMGVALHIIEPCGFPFDDKRLRRVAMDYYDLTTIVRHPSWPAFLDFHTAVDVHQSTTPPRLVLLTTRASTPLTTFRFEPADILLFGRESSGVPENVHSAASARVRVPVHATTRSLNLVQAASMVVCEALRQTNQFPGPSI